MLDDNEPVGGEPTGTAPAGDAAEGSATGGGALTPPAADRYPGHPDEEAGASAVAAASPAAGGAGTDPAAAGAAAEPVAQRAGAVEAPNEAPVRRARVSRRRTAGPATGEAPVGEAVTTGAAAGAGQAAAPGEMVAEATGEGVPAEVAEPAPPVKRTRRKKAAPAAAQPDVSDINGESAQTPPQLAVPPAVAPAGEPAPAKTTRARRRKAAAEPAAEIVTEAAPAPPVPAPGEIAAAEDEEAVLAEAAAVAAGGDEDEVADATDLAGPAEPIAERPAGRRRAATPPTVLFMAPEAGEEPAPVRRRSRKAAAAPPEETEVTEAAVAGTAEDAEPAETGRRRRRARRGAAEPAEAEVETPEVEAPEEAEPAAEAEEAEAAEEAEEYEDEDAAGRRRRRRGRRGRGRGRGGAEEELDEEPAAAEAEEEEPEAEGEEDEPLTRRRRRRRRKGAAETEAVDDGVPTVVKIREPRRPADEVQGVSGSTRLEAKRQRRRDGREQRRTRPPILTESEFLARREAVDRQMVIRQRGDRTQVAVLEDGVLVEHYVSRSSSGTMAGNVYLGKVQNVLPSMEAAFVDIGRGRNAVLYAGEVNWDATGLEGRSRSIEQALRSGDSVLVQVTKDPIGHKGARLTSHIALSGRHLVYVPNGNASGISRKLPDTERKRLRDVLKKLVPDGAGVIVRTAAEGASEDELARDVKRLQTQWDDIQAKAAQGNAPAMLSEEPDLVIRVVRDLFNEDFRELVVQGEDAYGMVEAYLAHVSPDLVDRLHRYTGTGDVFASLRIDEQILKALDRKVFLPSGGHLVIDRTEAMTVVDVNTGKYTGAGGNLEETVTRNNLEAAEEIVRQLRLRDLGGIVVIDFIDMVLESNRELVLRRLTECLGRDRTKHQVTEITSLGLVQMTRKRIGAGLLEAFSETCECCKGRGVIIHPEPVGEKPKQGAGDKVKAVASAGAQANGAEPTGRKRGRRGGGNGVAVAEPATERTAERADEPEPAAETPTERPVPDDYEDTMGYDLSRYEMSEAAEPGADEADEHGDEDGDDDAMEDGVTVSNGRRRSRRGGTRRRTRP
ncbi:Rne/Rng family ribonuclease [Rhizomonospora bruguierae]|uniref:Rne/Rng family ribonuclease n=1 Tax=Rhizomonospora bruguierae TaxID=1581705 RepID=UPI001BCCFD51|nr:Rne/Rng family ribonuclease [Micromonospora sp. NBRC 107566]